MINILSSVNGIILLHHIGVLAVSEIETMRRRRVSAPRAFWQSFLL